MPTETLSTCQALNLGYKGPTPQREEHFHNRVRIGTHNSEKRFPASNYIGCFRRIDLDKPQLQRSSQLPGPRSLQVIRAVGHLPNPTASPEQDLSLELFSCSQFLPPRAVPVLREREKDLGLLAMCP